jgi:hypothetical protein
VVKGALLRVFFASRAVTLLGPPADSGKLIAAETGKWGNVIRATNIKSQ